MNELLAFAASFLLVGTKVFQQKNVMHHLYVPAFVTSFIIAIAEVTVILMVVEKSYYIVPYIGIGGGLAAISSMYLHKRIFKTPGASSIRKPES